MFLLAAFLLARLVYGTYKMIDFVLTAFPYRNQIPMMYYFYSVAALFLGTLNFYWFNLMISSVRSRFKEKKQ
jgi:hypothetical protein